MDARANKLRGLAVVGLCCGALSSACGGSGENTAPQALENQGGTQNQGGAQATGGLVSGGQPTASATCVASPTALTGAGRLDIPVRVTSDQTAMSIGVAASGREGREYKLSLFKFFLSQPELVDAAGRAISAQFVTSDGAPLPYGLALVDAEDPASQTLRLAATAGSYTALRLGVGVPASCNHVTSADQVFPLNPDSDMFWVWGSQFMFIRLEGNSRPSASTDWAPFLYHLGFDAAFKTVSIPGQLVVGTSGAGPVLAFDVDQLLTTDAANLPPGQHTATDEFVLKNLEQQHPLHFE